jgi:hypothetical protein
MPRSASKYCQCFALIGDLDAGACLLRHRHGDPLRFLFRWDFLKKIYLLNYEMSMKTYLRDSISNKLSREFLVNPENPASVAEFVRDMLGCPNLRSFLRPASTTANLMDVDPGIDENTFPLPSG